MKKAMSFSILFLLVASIWGSPVFAGAYGSDSAFFSLMGRLILDGKVMYRDYLDVKGPVFFFWEAFGQLFIRGRGGIFVIECICMLATAAFLYKICRFYELNKKTIIFVHAVFYLIYAPLQIVGGTCADKDDCKKLILTGLIGAGISNAVILLFPKFHIMLVAGAFAGLHSLRFGPPLLS